MAEQLTRKEQDYLRLVKSGCQFGAVNCKTGMERYVHHRNEIGVPIIDLEQTYNKLRLAARLIAGIPNAEDVLAVSSRELGQRAVIKFAKYTGAQATSNTRWTPGVLTNHVTKAFQEPRLMIVVDTFADRKAMVESSYMGIPIIALCNTDSNLQFVDVAIPCNTRSTESISMIFWLLAREVRVLTSKMERKENWDVLVDLFYYKDIEKQEEEERLREQQALKDAAPEGQKAIGGGDDEEDEAEDDGEWGEDDN